jgi:hypothetical protein
MTAGLEAPVKLYPVYEFSVVTKLVEFNDVATAVFREA